MVQLFSIYIIELDLFEISDSNTKWSFKEPSKNIVMVDFFLPTYTLLGTFTIVHTNSKKLPPYSIQVWLTTTISITKDDGWELIYSRFCTLMRGSSTIIGNGSRILSPEIPHCPYCWVQGSVPYKGWGLSTLKSGACPWAYLPRIFLRRRHSSLLQEAGTNIRKLPNRPLPPIASYNCVDTEVIKA